ncbi:MFS transporter [Burkholderia stagnalis]|uniref:MFS transporter n=1 Tax=Burkholderia stagnalis TaxID=1503054 RepID=UPI000F5FEED2|nr:MFS transporter [Burkholderia stagnalis]RQY11647.1 MFS transporter [Burkholderia stagnalis]
MTRPHLLTRGLRAARHDERCILIVSMFVAAVGSYLILPYYSIHATQHLGLPLSRVALLLTCIAVCERGIGIGGGFLVDRAGARTVITLGIALRVVSLVMLAYAETFSMLLAAALTSGSGSALFQIGGKTLLLARADNVRSFAMRNIALNVGIALGPLLGYPLIAHSFRTACLLNAGLFASILVYSRLLPKGPAAAAAAPSAPARNDIDLFSRELVFLYVTQALFFFFYTNFELTLPLFAKAHFGLFWVGMLFTINSVVVVLLSFSVARFSRRHEQSLPGGFVVLALSFGCFFGAIATPPAWRLACYVTGVLAFSVAEVYFMLAIELQMAAQHAGAALGRILAASAFASALGVAAGNLVLGPAYVRAGERMPVNYWLMLAIGCLLAFAALSVARRRVRHGSVAAPRPSPEPHGTR